MLETEKVEEAKREPESLPPTAIPGAPARDRKPWYIRKRRVLEQQRPRDRGYQKPCPQCEEITRFIPGSRANGMYEETCSVCDHTFRWLIVMKRDPDIGFPIGVSENFDLLDYYAAILGADFISSRVDALVLEELRRIGKRLGAKGRAKYDELTRRLEAILDS